MRQFASVLLGRRGFILRTKEHILSLIIHECDVFFTSGKCYLRTVIILDLLFQIVTILSRGKSFRKGVFINRREVVCTENLLFNRDSIYWSHLMTVSCCINILKSIRVKLSLEFMLTRKQMRFLLWVKRWTLLAKLFFVKKERFNDKYNALKTFLKNVEKCSA